MEKVYRSLGTAALAAVLAFGTVPGASAKDLAEVNATSAGVEWHLTGNHESAVLTLAGPGGGVLRQEFTGGETPSLSLFDASGERLPDGSYTWELRIAPALSKADKDKLKESRTSGSEAAWKELRASGKLPETTVQSGTFQIIGGAVIAGGLTEVRGAKKSGLSSAKSSSVTHIAEADQVIPDDLIVQGSVCVGFDCVNNESFGFDTIRMKENNLRIKFEDTQHGHLPDQRLAAHRQRLGERRRQQVLDRGHHRRQGPVHDHGRRRDQLDLRRQHRPRRLPHLDPGPRPARQHQQHPGDPPRAEQLAAASRPRPGTSAGNEANFFVRDVTGGSRLPFRIRPGAPTSSVDISADGDVGIGTASPDFPLHVSDSGATEIAIENTSGTAATWFFQVDNDTNKTLKISKEGTGGTEVTIDTRLNANGATMRVDGSVQGIAFISTSSRDMKTEFRELNGKEVLAKVSGLPITQWKFKEGSQERHIGPMAEDFHKAFQLNDDSKHISMTDINGVALAAIQGLNTILQEKDQEIASLKARLDALEKMIQGAAAQK